MSIKEVLVELNRLETDGVIARYAIGGAVGATFYIEPAATQDIDIFVVMKPDPGRLLVTLDPIYNALKARGARVEDEHLVVAGWPLQFLPAEGPLLAEALADARETEVEGAPVRIFTAEHLAALALELGRAKDKLRLQQFAESGVLDGAQFPALLIRHGLVEKWQRFEAQYLREQS